MSDVVVTRSGGQIGYATAVENFTDDAKVLQPTVLVTVPSLLQEIQIEWNNKVAEKDEEDREWVAKAMRVQHARYQRGACIHSARVWSRTHFGRAEWFT